jgi:hypothetical protein
MGSWRDMIVPNARLACLEEGAAHPPTSRISKIFFNERLGGFMLAGIHLVLSDPPPQRLTGYSQLSSAIFGIDFSEER